MQKMVEVLHHSLDAMHQSALACLTAGSGISELGHHQARAMVEFARHQLDANSNMPTLEMARRLFDEQLHIAARDACVLATGKMVEAHTSVFDATKSLIEQFHARLPDHAVAQTSAVIAEEAGKERSAIAGSQRIRRKT